jgi:ABC-type phosphate/phosphonate transport system substrate-binding protein
MWLASLPMYALPEMTAANAALWDAIRERLAAAGVAAVPAVLSSVPMALPQAIAPETLFSQMCGYPLRRLYDAQYRLLGVPLYDLPGCGWFAEGVPSHRSFIVVPRNSGAETVEELRGGRFAVNGWDSNSGMNLPRRLLAPLAGGAAFFSSVIVSGGHVRSMEMVATGEADVASIDCVTYGFCSRYRPELVARLRVVAETPASPAIPFITAAATPPETAEALTRILGEDVREALAGLRIVAVLPPRPEAYDAIMAYEAEAAALGYPVLA